MNNSKLTDEFDNIHYIKDELGRGGQGVVYSTKDGDVVIKEALKNNLPLNDEKEIKYFHQKIENIKYKPIPFDINIAKPVALLKNKAGYVMEMLNGMKPLKEIIPQELNNEKAKELQIPSFLEEFEKSDNRGARMLTYYLKTGGIRKRLSLLIEIAKILYRLHLNGLVYFDISYNNIFFRDEDNEVYFIDIDNLKYNSSIRLSNSVMTPGFEVPEVAALKEPNSFYSDIYAFAVLAFTMLTIHHPFDGNGLEEENDWDEDISQNNGKNRWDLEWIYGSNKENEAIPLMPKELSLTEGLFELFKKTFEVKDKKDRPTLNLWIKELSKARAFTVKCNKCNSTYYEYFKECPFCQTESPEKVIIYENNEKVFSKEIEKNFSIPEFVTGDFTLKRSEPLLKIKFIKEKVELYFSTIDNISVENKKIHLNRKKYGKKRLEKGLTLKVNNKDLTIRIEK